MKRQFVVNEAGNKEFFLTPKEIEQVNNYLNNFNISEALEYLGKIVREYDHGFEELSTITGITKTGLYKALSKKGNPKIDTWFPIFKALGIAPQLEKVI